MMYETTRNKNRHRVPKEEQISYKIQSYSTDISFCAATAVPRLNVVTPHVLVMLEVSVIEQC